MDNATTESNNDKDIQELEQFLLKSDELEKLEIALSEFNVFEVLGIVKTEIKHSNVLGWLLNPRENHGLGDIFLRDFLKHLFVNNRDVLKEGLSFFNVALFDLDDIEIFREVDNIDLKIVSKLNDFVIIIENKVLSSVHGNQLERYHQKIEAEYPENIHKLYVYLTPDGVRPENEDKWIIEDYSTISAILDKILRERKTLLNTNVYDFLNQYSIILRRYIVANSDIEKICVDIYKKYSKALDIIFKYKPDAILMRSNVIKELIKNNEDLILDSNNKTYIGFIPKQIDNLIPKTGQGWTSTNRVLLFEFKNYIDNNSINKLRLQLIIGPGDTATRKKILNVASKDQTLFNKFRTRPDARHKTIYQKYFKDNNFEDTEYEYTDIQKTFDKEFKHFLDDDFRIIVSHFEQHWPKD